MLVQFGNNWIQKFPLTAKLDSAYGLVQFWLSSEFSSSNYFQIGQHVVLLHILMKVSVAGTSLKESEKKITNHSARKTTVSKLKKAKIVSSEYIANVTGNRGLNFLNDYDEADEEERR